MTNKFNVYSNIYTPKVKDYTTISEWFDLIKQSDYSQSILAVRKHDRESSFYKSQKATFPAITYNFNFQKNKNKSNATIAGATGLMYVDIDDLSFDISTLNSLKLFAYHRSLSGLGYVILVQVDGLSLANYDSTYKLILSDLGLTKYYDKNAKKATQFNVLSYDPDIFINYNSFVFSASDELISNDFSPLTVVTKKKKTYTTTGGEEIVNNDKVQLRYDNLDRENIIGNYAFNWDGWEYINAWLPFNKIKSGKRNSTLLSYTNNLVWLNPDLTERGMENILSVLNAKRCEEPMTVGEIKSIVRCIYRAKADGTLKPIFNLKSRKIVFANQTGLNKDEKFAICRELYNEHRQNQSLQKLNNIIGTWDFNKYGKIGQAVIHENFPINKKTVEKYWFEFKDEVKILNDSYYKSSPAAQTKIKKQTKNMNKSKINEALIAETSEATEAAKQAQIKTLQAVRTSEATTLSDVRKESTSGLTIANYSKYERAIKIISVTPLITMRRQIQTLLDSGYEGESVVDADGYKYTFNLYPALDTVEFRAVA